MQSMTGYGQGQAEGNGYKIDVTIKSVNAKFLDIELKAPKSILAMEDQIKKILVEKIKRGTVTVFVNITKNACSNLDVVLDTGLASSIFNKTTELANLLKIDSHISAKDLVKFNGVLTTQEAEVSSDLIYESVKNALIIALENFIVAREKEGENLKVDLKEKVDSLTYELEKIKIKAPLVQKEYYEKLKARVEELIADKIEDEAKLISEVAFFADKADINEEIVRLSSHIMQFNDYLLESGAVGKKLEFLSQEMTREINTIGSKANNIDITKSVLNAKNLNESIKEQIRNVE